MSGPERILSCSLAPGPSRDNREEGTLEMTQQGSGTGLPRDVQKHTVAPGRVILCHTFKWKRTPQALRGKVKGSMGKELRAKVMA